jgi:hypothetical protein
MKILYISGPFGKVPEGYDLLHGIQHNINEASRYALMAARAGWAPFTPHKNTADFQHITDIPNETWMEICLAFVQKSDAILMIPGWKDSPGAIREHNLALMSKIPIYYYEKTGMPGPKEN